MTAALFIGFLAAMAATVVFLIARYDSRRAGLRVLVGLLVWFVYVGLVSYLGVVRDSATPPPGMVFVFFPVVLFLIIFAIRSFAGSGVSSIPLWIILSLQSFRVIVELFLHQLWVEGLVPRMLTFSGANFDIYLGASAPVVAWLSMKGKMGLKAALMWNMLGLLVLANVVIRAVLTAPGPLNRLHAEVPNLMIGTFPYTFIPGFFVPLAVALHVLAIRACASRLHEESPT
jgi:hypothetical protein